MTEHAHAQLDLFRDTRAVMLANDVADALLATDAARARRVFADLLREAPRHPAAIAMQVLIDFVERWQLPAPRASDIARMAGWIAAEIRPAARQALGSNDVAFIRPFYRALADCAIGLDYDPGHPAGHRADLCLQCDAFTAAEAASLSIPRWQVNPDALAWLTTARYRLYGLDAARPSLFALAWCGPKRCESVITTLADPALDRDWRAFLGASEWESVGDDTLPAWFPAWTVIEHPAIKVDPIDTDLPSAVAVRATTMLVRIRELEKQGSSRALLTAREALRDLNGELFAIYMARRAIGLR
ncbi:MAG: hypothetical protein ACKVQT_38745 [Burkholderiales bacterium]